MITLDYLPDSNGDLKILSGDFVVGDGSEFHIKRILQRVKGATRSAPLVGVGAGRYLKAPGSPRVYQELAREIRLQLEFDGFAPRKLQVNNLENISIEAVRIK